MLLLLFFLQQSISYFQILTVFHLLLEAEEKEEEQEVAQEPHFLPGLNYCCFRSSSQHPYTQEERNKIVVFPNDFNVVI
jgi:hypothetical protein